MPCRAISVEIPGTPEAPETPEAAARGAAPDTFSSSPKPSAAGFAPPDDAAAEVDEVELTFIEEAPHPADLTQLVNGGLRIITPDETC
jgi:hypothetical protein